MIGLRSSQSYLLIPVAIMRLSCGLPLAYPRLTLCYLRFFAAYCGLPLAYPRLTLCYLRFFAAYCGLPLAYPRLTLCYLRFFAAYPWLTLGLPSAIFDFLRLSFDYLAIFCSTFVLAEHRSCNFSGQPLMSLNMQFHIYPQTCRSTSIYFILSSQRTTCPEKPCFWN